MENTSHTLTASWCCRADPEVQTNQHFQQLIRSFFLHIEDDEFHAVLGGGFEHVVSFDSTSTDRACLGSFQIWSNLSHSWQRARSMHENVSSLIFYNLHFMHTDKKHSNPSEFESHDCGGPPKGIVFLTCRIYLDVKYSWFINVH